MGTLTFIHGTMHSSKTAQLLMEAYNRKLQGKRIVAIRPNIDTRTREGVIKSRTPLDEIECLMIGPEETFSEVLEQTDLTETDRIMIDEAQFLTKEQVYELHVLTIVRNIDVVAYGLKNSYVEGQLFEGSAALLFYADKISEITTDCQLCNKKATQNLRVVDGTPVYEGGIVNIGDIKGEEKYLQVCNEHYFLGGVE